MARRKTRRHHVRSQLIDKQHAAWVERAWDDLSDAVEDPEKDDEDICNAGIDMCLALNAYFPTGRVPGAAQAEDAPAPAGPEATKPAPNVGLTPPWASARVQPAGGSGEAERPDLSHDAQCSYRHKGECDCYKDDRKDDTNG